MFEKDHSPEILDIVYVEKNSGWSFPLHAHEDGCEISFIIDGKSDYYYNSDYYLVSKHYIVVKNCGVVHSETAIADDPVEQICVILKNVHIKGMDENKIVNGTLSVFDSKEYGEVFDRLFVLLRNEENESIKKEIINLILSIIIKLDNRKEYIYPKNRKGKEVIAAIKNYLDIHYGEKIVLSDLSKLFYISEYYMCREFKKDIGYSINDYIIDRRMGKASNLLMSSDYSIKDIASMCGYSDIHYFYATFKKRTGMTPVQFKESYKKHNY